MTFKFVKTDLLCYYKSDSFHDEIKKIQYITLKNVMILLKVLLFLDKFVIFISRLDTLSNRPKNFLFPEKSFASIKSPMYEEFKMMLFIMKVIFFFRYSIEYIFWPIRQCV
jgi:hypothetical protein